MFRSVLYRAGQFFRGLFAQVRPDEEVLVQAWLSPAEKAIFDRMPRRDRRHSLDVFYTLRDAGYGDSILLKAALLHDAGKSDRRLTLVHRVAVVLLRRRASGLLERWARDGRGWKAGFAIHVDHPKAAARMAAYAGSDPEVVDLIHKHQAHPASDERVRIFQWADGQN
ncbi:MAG: HD domain-containing protein [Anaerolineae bacterium]|nr:HD domain-containing protein [Anaerolineae bacterium]